MIIPKIEFSIAPLDQIFSLIHEFLNPAKGQWDWSKPIYKNYPELKSKLQNVKDKKKRKEIEYRFFTEVFNKKRMELEKRAKIFQRKRNKLDNKVLITLSKVIEQKWTEKDRK